MPSMIESLVDELGFARSRVELLVPLTVSLLRVGPMVYYVCATLFIAQLYEERALGAIVEAGSRCCLHGCWRVLHRRE